MRASTSRAIALSSRSAARAPEDAGRRQADREAGAAQVPLALIGATPVGTTSREDAFAVTYPLVHEYLSNNYERIGTTNFDASTDVRYGVWVHKRWAATTGSKWSPLRCATPQES